ncbi:MULTISPECIES: hypothetical protein [Bacillus]|uniref:hypothetical protein n=1 Tax=Bacillus TaxID=1386 RepID=UPI00090B71D3|nr:MULTISPECIES: hypothetical protein [Bacillus]APJ12888.1 hypothetical protein BSL056_18865 [Bacillus safensis]MCY7433039.1 hypothetical protein [Bacillus safensis]MDI0191368.1 hypothetical protein [Bacillus safensis]NRF03899.1 hypothetical protein [Bacillus safensis]QSJ01744.1 hypothetical protein JJ692_03630 [Bacillus sp. 3a]
MKYFKLFLLACAIAVVCSACSKKEEAVGDSSKGELSNMKDSKFAVIHSKMMDRGCEIVNYNDTGSKLSSVSLKDCVGFTSSTQSDNNMYFSSNRSNYHVLIDKNNGEVNHLQTKSLSKSTDDEGAFFINYSNGYVLHDINVGFTENGLVGELVYWKEDGGNKKQVELEGSLTSAVFEDGKIYAVINNNNDSVIASSIDSKNHKEKRKEIDMASVFFPDNNESLKSLNNKELLVAVNDAVDSKKNSMLVILDKKTLDTKRKIVMDKGFTIYKINVDKERVTIVSYEGEVKTFNKDLKEISSEKIPLHFKSDDERLEEVKILGGKIYALVRMFDRDKDGVIGRIIEYNIESKDSKEISLKSDRDWEMTSMEVIR